MSKITPKEIVTRTKCSICNDIALDIRVNSLLGDGVSIYRISKITNVSESTIRRHYKRHYKYGSGYAGKSNISVKEVSTGEDTPRGLEVSIGEPKKNRSALRKISVLPLDRAGTSWDNCNNKKKIKDKIKKELTKEEETEEYLKNAEIRMKEASRSIGLDKTSISTNIKYLFLNSVELIEKSREKNNDMGRIQAMREARATLELVVKASELFVKATNKSHWHKVINKIINSLDNDSAAKEQILKILDE